MDTLVAYSKVIRSEAAGDRKGRTGKLIQDRYSLHCLPQYLGPIIDGIVNAARQIEVEANCANDNPLIDPDSGEIFHTGNFLAQYTGVAMDQLRYFIGLLAKHIDTQIALSLRIRIVALKLSELSPVPKEASTFMPSQSKAYLFSA
jgi:phenylalanine ammonia-lyase